VGSAAAQEEIEALDTRLKDESIREHQFSPDIIRVIAHN